MYCEFKIHRIFSWQMLLMYLRRSDTILYCCIKKEKKLKYTADFLFLGDYGTFIPLGVCVWVQM